MSLLGNPERSLRVIHVGYQWQGSIAMMINRILEEAGYRVGLFISLTSIPIQSAT